MTTQAIAGALPQYEIGDELGSGAMGVVVAGTHRALGRSVAIKQLTLTLAGDPGMDARFEAEAKLLARLDHPHIVPIYDYVRGERISALVMERLDGGTVWDRFDERGLNAAESCAIGLAMLAGLHAAHKAGVLHLDVKPKNLLFSAQGQLKVADFGISQVVSAGATMVTSDGRVLGTPSYIAPEQALGQRLTPAADVYAAGTVLYEVLTGRLPYAIDDAGNALAMIHRHVYEDPAPMGPRVPAPLAAVVMRSLARDPAHRFADAEAFAVGLATAATQVLGPGWLEQAHVPLHLTPRVSAATAILRGASAPTAPLTTVRPDHDAFRAARLGSLNKTELMPASAVLRPDHAPVPPQRHHQRQQPPVQPQQHPSRVQQPPPHAPRPQQQPPARQASSALVPLAIAACAVLLAILFPVVRHESTKPVGMTHIEIDGAGRYAPVVLDPGDRVELSGGVPSGASGDALRVRLRFTFAGVPIGDETVDAEVDNGRWRARVEWSGVGRWMISGAALGRVDLLADGYSGGEAVVDSEEFTVHPDRPPLVSVIGGGSVLLILFALSYLESVTRSIRRGRRGLGFGGVLTAFPGVLLGVGIWVLMLSLLRHDATTVDVVVPAVLGAVAGVGLAVAASRSAAN